MISLKAAHVSRYLAVAKLLVKYRHAEAMDHLGLEPAIVAEARSEAVDGEPRPEDLARDLERLGPTFIKLGQLLSTRADFLPPAYLDALARLQDDVEPI